MIHKLINRCSSQGLLRCVFSSGTLFFPSMISNLPAADIPIDGLKSYLLQGNNKQTVFMEFAKEARIPEHCHEEQWGVVLDDQMELTINGTKHLLKKGDSYHIPKNVMHSAVIYAGYKDVTVFNQSDRYKIKE